MVVAYEESSNRSLLHKYRDQLMNIVNKYTKRIGSGHDINIGYPSYEKVCYSSSESSQVPSSPDSCLADNETTDISLSRARARKVKRLHFSNNIDTLYYSSDSSNLSRPEFVTSTPVLYKTKVTETPKPMTVKIQERESSSKSYESILATPLESNSKIAHSQVTQEQRIGSLQSLELSPPTVPSRNKDNDIDDKFVVNLFESRQSKRWKTAEKVTDESKRKTCSNTLKTSKNYKNITDGNERFDDTRKKITSPASTAKTRTASLEKYKNSEEYKHFLKLKTQRDVECLKMTEASKALQMLKRNSNRKLTDELLAEKILLEAVEKEKLLINEIRESAHAQVKSVSHSGTIQLLNFAIQLVPSTTKSGKKSKQFFVLTASCGTQLFVSGVRQPDEDNVLRFNQHYEFANVEKDFNIKLQLFFIKLKKEKNIFKQKFNCQCCPTSKVLYSNLNTCEYEEKEVMKPSFKAIAELNLTKHDLDSHSFTFKQKSGLQQNLNLLAEVDNASFIFKIKDVSIKSNLSGFLTVGQRNEKYDVIFWERKWCVLDGMELLIYNYPCEQDFGVNPLMRINLKYCFCPIIQKFSVAPKKRTFVLKTGHPSTSNGDHSQFLFSKPNFILKKYYFSADSQNEFNTWSTGIKSILDFMGDWNQLFFNEEYYAYMKTLL